MIANPRHALIADLLAADQGVEEISHSLDLSTAEIRDHIKDMRDLGIIAEIYAQEGK